MAQTLLGHRDRATGGRDRLTGGQGETGALVLHGLTSSPASVAPLVAALEGHATRSIAPVLPGHGDGAGSLSESRYRDWLAGARAGLAELEASCATVVVIGHSMGATLACELAASGARVDGLVAINPFVEPPDPTVRELLAAAESGGTEAVYFNGSDLCRPDPGHRGAQCVPIAALCSLIDALGPLSERLGAIDCPTLVCSSRVDHVVPTTNGAYLAQRVRGPVEHIWLEASYHLATLDHDAALLAERCAAFVDAIGAHR